MIEFCSKSNLNALVFTTTLWLPLPFLDDEVTKVLYLFSLNSFLKYSGNCFSVASSDVEINAVVWLLLGIPRNNR